MRQLTRLFVRPWAFFGQLQWSSNHWIILISFLTLATIETQVGKHNLLYHSYASLMASRLDIDFNIALWGIMAVRLAILLAGAFAITFLVWVTGTMIGKYSSRRVLLRRLTIVFSILLSSYAVRHYIADYPYLTYVSLSLFLWGLFLGFYAIKESFFLNNLETAVVSAFAFLAIVTSWHFSHEFFEKAIRKEISAVAKQEVRSRGIRR